MQIHNFMVHIKADDIYKDIAKDVETKFDTENHELDRPLPKAKNKKVIGLMKDELSGKNHNKVCCIKIENYKNCLEATQLKNKMNHLEKN